MEGGFISGGYDGVIRIYDGEGEIIADLSGHSSGITSLSHGPNHTILSGSWDGSVRVISANVFYIALVIGKRYGD